MDSEDDGVERSEDAGQDVLLLSGENVGAAANSELESGKAGGELEKDDEVRAQASRVTELEDAERVLRERKA